MNFFKRFFTMLLALCMTFGITTTTAFAAEEDASKSSTSIAIPVNESIIYQDEDVVITCVNETEQKSLMSAKATTYESVWLNSSDSGSFVVNTQNSGTIGVTLKVESSSNSSFAYLSIQKPNGSYFKENVYVSPTTNNGNGGVYKMYFASSGNYTIHYVAYTDVGMRIMCWLY